MSLLLDNIEVIKGILKHGHWRVNENILKTSTLIEMEIKISLLKCGPALKGSNALKEGGK